MSRSMDLVQDPAATERSEISHTRHLMDLLGTANEANHQAQRLSLSLGSCMLVPSVQYGHRSLNSDLLGSNYLISGAGVREACNLSFSDEYSLASSSFPSSDFLNRNGTGSLVTVIGNSRYLKPAQYLLEEFVSVGGKAIDLKNDKYVARLSRSRREALGLPSELKDGLLSTEKHELQIKITNLIALLEEVDSRYEEYYHQMEEVVLSFEAIAGLGAAKSYTALALQAMSRHFCHLRDAITSQINLARRKVSKDLPKVSMGLSQLSLFDQETRQNHGSLQQIGMIQNQRQAWRPIRGLPETSVEILRTWLFEHFLHPYPNDSEKLMLASQTGLTKNQVSNWFINARVRLWKPMIEEMYKEEFADSSVEPDPLFASCSMTRDSVTYLSDE
ncbi:BEL1-like homeodomain protein 11 isoform X2 [Malania oleifera]|nr:BEL1-like homeodomain protein 11 isoform X2 [Malania oleifera]